LRVRFLPVLPHFHPAADNAGPKLNGENMKLIIEKIQRFFHEVVTEMKAVSWPTKDDIKEGTVVVIVISGIVALFLSLVDFGFGQLFGLLFKLI
jgi:preprotein translocase subunit SecE